MIILGELMAYARDQEAKGAQIPDTNISLANKAGMLSTDVTATRIFTASQPRYCIITAAPRLPPLPGRGCCCPRSARCLKKTGVSCTAS